MMSEMPPQKKIYPKVTIPDVLREYFRVAKGYWLTILIVSITTTIPVIASGIIAPVFYKHVFDLLSGGSAVPGVVSQLISGRAYG